MNKCRFDNKMHQKTKRLTKIFATQSVIRNKFIEAYTNRIDHENDVNKTIKRPFTSISFNKNSSLKINVINKLCKRLQKLINLWKNGNDNYNQELKIIIDKLRQHEIIV